MCGITGIVSADTSLVSHQRIKTGTDTLVHRGPEGEGFFINDSQQAALGHRRLCIIDLSEAAAQPMKYADRYHIVHNGELYNFPELKTELEKQGCHFRTSSDTEVILAAYAQYGPDCLNRFDGMFAFAIWDEKEKVLFAARDRFGEKPFYFFYDEKQLLFASELKALWKMNVPRQVNRKMLYNFLTIDYTTNPGDPSETFFEGIKKLPAASSLTYSLDKNELLIEKYWQPYIDVNHSISEEQAIDRFNELFNISISRKLRSDVAIGTSLSGGLDSSAVVAFCDKQTSKQYSHKCFTGFFTGFEKDEQQHASAVAKKFGLEHHLVTIDPSEVVSLMEKLMEAQESPFISGSPLIQYKVFEKAKQNGVTVLLDGQGADEILGGYHKYYKWYWQELYRQKKLSKSEEMSVAHDIGIKEKFGLKYKIAALLPEFTSSILQGRKIRTAANEPDLNKDFAAENKPFLYYSLPTSFDLNGALYYNSFVNGLEELLHLADRNSMAHSVEVRLPFLYHELVSFLFTLPSNFKIRNGWTKWLLRESLKEKLPPAIVWRKEKVGFEPPQKDWMEQKDVQDAIHSAREALVDQAILNRNILRKKIQPHDAHVAENKDWKYWTASFLFRG